MRAMDIRSAEPRRTDYERRVGRSWSAYILRGGEAGRVGSEGALGECSKHLNYGGVIPGGLIEVQGLGKGPPGVLTRGAAEQGVLSGLDLLLAPWAEPRVWVMPRRTRHGIIPIGLLAVTVSTLFIARLITNVCLRFYSQVMMTKLSRIPTWVVDVGRAKIG